MKRSIKSLSSIRSFLFLFIQILIVQTILASDLVFTQIDASLGLSDNQIRHILQLPDGRMVFTTSGNVNLYDGVQFTYLHRLPEHIYPLKIYEGHYHVYLDGDSLLWIKDTHKLMCIDLYQEKYIPQLEDYFAHKGVGTVEDFFMDTENGIWLLTSRGLLQHNTSRFFDISSNQGVLQDLMVEGDKLYLFYHTGSVVCYHIETQQRLYESAAYPVEEQPNFQSTSLVVKGADGFYQLRNGTKGGFFYFNPQEQSWTKILEQEYWLNTLIITPEELAYISSVHGIWIIDPRESKQQYLPTLKTVDGNIISTEISTLFYDQQGGLWVGTLNRGLFYYHPHRYKFSYVGHASFPVTPAEEIAIQRFAEDKEGNIYLKSHSKTFLYQPQTENLRTLKEMPLSSLPPDVAKEFSKGNSSSFFQGEWYTSLCTDSRGWTWAGTSDGLNLFIPGAPGEVFYTEDGLANNFIHALLEDRNHNIWATTSCGISQILVDTDPQKIRFKNFNTYDGTLKGEYIRNAIYEAADGTLYFGGIDGFNVLYPDLLSSSPPLPSKPIFTALRLRGEEVKIGEVYDDRTLLDKATPYTHFLEFSYNQNFLTFEFSALNYLNRAKTCYKYLLKGVDSEWNETIVGGQGGQTNTDGILRASYTNLSPGKYTLKVMASDNQQQWSEETTEITFIIHTPWWKTRTAYSLLTLFILIFSAGSIYLYIYITKRRLERKHKEEILLLRIRSLIEQCNQYEERQELITQSSMCLTEQKSLSEDNNCENIRNAADEEFLTRAMEQVEKNLNTPGYSVEQLSRDLCMDRTGLYRKLIALLDESPSLFIRNIRLKRAAQLLIENQLSITEIAEKVGFSTSSYMSKCFQELYGCRPSEYAERVKKST